jgi:hypothetical protein
MYDFEVASFQVGNIFPDGIVDQMFEFGFWNCRRQQTRVDVVRLGSGGGIY